VRRRREALGVLARPPLAVLILVAAALLACALAVPLRLSADAWAYAGYGALLAHGADPWSHAWRAADVAPFHDPLLDAALRAWDGSLPRDVYGPLFTAPCAGLVVALRGWGPGAVVSGLRALAALALLACIGLASRTRPRLARLLAFHPVVLWSAAEGHNDPIWLALVLAADLTRTPNRRSASEHRTTDRGHSGWKALAALIAAAAVKAVALVPLVGAIARRRGGRRLLAALAAAAALGLAYAPLAWSVISHGLDHGAGPPRVSLLHAAALATWSGSPIPLAIGAFLGLPAVAAVARALRGGDRTAGLALLGWLVLPGPEPWYALWLVPVVALAGPTPASRALLAASLTGVAGYVQDLAVGTALRDPALLGGTMLALYALPLLVALASPAGAPLDQAPSPAVVTAAPAPAAVTPAPAPTATTTPAPPATQPAPNPFGYIVVPSPGPTGQPQFLEIAANDKVLHPGQLAILRVTTTTDVTSVVANALGSDLALPQAAPGVFGGQEQLPGWIPFWYLGKNYTVTFTARTSDGRAATTTLPIRLQR
jgi:hypothetical protein